MFAAPNAYLTIAPGVQLWPGYYSPAEQRELLNDVLSRLVLAPFYIPTMPKNGTPLSVSMTNFGSLGWVSDKEGYRYQPHHPISGQAWPEIPPMLLALWKGLAHYRASPEACLVNYYRSDAKMGLHRDADEEARDAPVLSVSLGDTAAFAIGGTERKGKTHRFPLACGDVLLFGGPARLAYHGVSRIFPGTSGLLSGTPFEQGRINLTLRRVTAPGARIPASL